MPLGEHLAELQRRFVVSLIAVAVAAVAGWFLSEYILGALREPLEIVMHTSGRQTQINYQDISGPFNVRMHIAMVTGIVLASPVLLWEIWGFLVPGLKRKEKIGALAFVSIGVPLFLTGCTFGWFALPNLVSFFTSFAGENDTQLVSADIYIRFIMYLMLFMGIGFVLPLLLVLLNLVGVLSGKAIFKGWRVAIVVALIFAAFITPPTDIVSMFLLSTPMLALYLLAGLFALWNDRRVARRNAEFLDDDSLLDDESHV